MVSVVMFVQMEASTNKDKISYIQDMQQKTTTTVLYFNLRT